MIWYYAKLTQPYPPFSAGERVAVCQVGQAFDICTTSGLYLTRLTADEAVKVLRSERDGDGYSIRIEAPDVLEAHIELKRDRRPGDRERAPVYGRVNEAAATVIKPVITGWRCFRIECGETIEAECGKEFRWKEQPDKCPKCGSELFIVLYGKDK